MTELVKADASHLKGLLPLFEAYRNFYGQESNKILAQNFLTDRMEREESVVFIAYVNQVPVGFTQLYTTFSSVSLESFYILNDLYVDAGQRGQGIGRQLLEKAKEHCKNMGYKGLALETAKDNPAQDLYEKLNWKKDSQYLHYFWTNTKD